MRENIAYFQLSAELLENILKGRQSLELPDDFQIVRAETVPFYESPDTIRVYIESKEIIQKRVEGQMPTSMPLTIINHTRDSWQS